MRRLAIALVAFAVTGCKPAEPSLLFNAHGGLDCGKGFEALSSEIAERPGIIGTTYERGSNAWRDDRSLDLFVVTQPDHPAHPAIFVRHVILTTEGSSVSTDFCGYGDGAETRRMVEAYNTFDRVLNAEEACYLCDQARETSPSLWARTPPPPKS